MTPKILAALLGVLGGLLLVTGGGLPLLAHEAREWHGTLAVAGYAATIGALVAMGYALVAHAPWWLRTIVSIAFPLLAASVWQLVDQAIHDRIDGYEAAATTHLLAGAIALVGALIGLRRPARETDDTYAPTHR